MGPLALRLAEWSASLRGGALPNDLRGSVKLWILDTLGLILAGFTEPSGQAVLAVARRQGGAPEATVVGDGDRLPAALVALVHGTLAHSLDFDDTFPDSVVHPGSLVVPVALAVGEAVNADGEALLAAVAAGYEVAARLGAVAGRRFHARGFQASGVLGPVVTALVAGTLERLPPRQTAQAMGLAGSTGGGLLEFLSDGSWSKRLHPGWAGHAGVLTAALAAVGFPGPLSVLEGRHGLYAAFLGSGVVDPSGVATDLGRAWKAREAAPKFYPCAHAIHPFLDAALALRARHALSLDDIAGIECRVAPWQVPIVCEPRPEKVAPRTEYQARASLPFALAAAFVDGRVDLETFTPSAIGRPDLAAVATRVSHVEDPSAASGFSGAVRVYTRAGRGLELEAPPPGPAEPDRVRAKFRTTASRLLPEAGVTRLEAAIADLVETTPAGLLALCRRPGPSTSSTGPAGTACPPTSRSAGSP